MIIPAANRAPVSSATGFPTVGDFSIAYPQALTIGFATTSGTLRINRAGSPVVSVATPGNGASAIGITDIERRGSRVWGRMCSGSVALPTVGGGGSSFRQAIALSGPQNYSGRYAGGNIVFDWPTRDARIFGEVDNYLRVSTREEFPNFKVADGPVGTASHKVDHKFTGTVREIFWQAINTGGFAGGSITVTATRADDGDTPAPSIDPLSAIAYLAYARSGLPWWGVIDAAARAGDPVRRAAWLAAAQPSRIVVYAAGAGTARAVGVSESGTVITPDLFSAAEFLATDWQLVTSTSAGPLIDLTDYTFSGGGTGFIVGAASTTDPGTTDPITGDPGSSGFLFRKSDGTTILVPGADCSGTTYAP